MAKYPQKHLQISHVLMDVLAMDTIGCLPVTSRGNQWAYNSNMYAHVKCVFYTCERNIGRKHCSHLPGIFTHKGGSIAILSDNGKGFKMQFSLIHVNNLA